MTLQKLEPELLALAPNEKAQAIQILAQSLGNTWREIEKTPGVCGGDACIWWNSYSYLGAGKRA